MVWVPSHSPGRNNGVEPESEDAVDPLSATRMTAITTELL